MEKSFISLSIGYFNYFLLIKLFFILILVYLNMCMCVWNDREYLNNQKKCWNFYLIKIYSKMWIHFMEIWNFNFQKFNEY